LRKGAQNFQGRTIGDLVLRDRTEPLRSFEPLSGEVNASAGTRAYQEAFTKLEAGDPAALSAFAALVGINADDCLASFHLKRLLNGEKGARIILL
jgi:adenylate cyclase